MANPDMEWLTAVLGHIRSVCNGHALSRPDKAELAAARLLAVLGCDQIINPSRADLIEAAEIEKED
jgi:hypothetical protein